jgi:hypothetical protein
MWIVLVVVLVSIGSSGGASGQSVRANFGVLDAREPVSYYIDEGAGVSGVRASDRELARMAFVAWSRETQGQLRFVEAKSKAEALISVEWADPEQGSFGVTQRVRVGGKPGAIVYVTADLRMLGNTLSSRATSDPLLRDTIVYLTCVHEIGHAVGMTHTDKFDDIMYSFGFGGDIVQYFSRYRAQLKSRDDIRRFSGLSQADIEFLRSLYPRR